jgi:hypothetical protein
VKNGTMLTLPGTVAAGTQTYWVDLAGFQGDEVELEFIKSPQTAGPPTEFYLYNVQIN